MNYTQKVILGNFLVSALSLDLFIEVSATLAVILFEAQLVRLIVRIRRC
jgi:hypothetical protein